MLKMLCNIVFKCISKLTQCLAGFWLPFPLNSLVFGPLSKCLAIDLSLAEHRLRHYNTFQSIFIRKLATPRTIDHSSAFVCPADGTIAAISNIKSHPNLVIKNQDYTIQSVLTNKPIPSEGSATLIYLAPHNIHRFVMPKTAVVKTITHVPGALYPVNPSMLKPFGHVFAENERVILTCESNNVPWYFVAIAALNVGQQTHGHIKKMQKQV